MIKFVIMNEKILYNQIKSVVRDSQKTNYIMILLFPQNKEYYFTRCDNGHFFKTMDGSCKHCIEESLIENPAHKFFSFLSLLKDEEMENEPITDVVSDYKLDKKKEILDSLEYLKSKEFKTKKDRDSIYTLETVLKSFS